MSLYILIIIIIITIFEAMLKQKQQLMFNL